MHQITKINDPQNEKIFSFFTGEAPVSVQDYSSRPIETLDQNKNLLSRYEQLETGKQKSQKKFRPLNPQERPQVPIYDPERPLAPSYYSDEPKKETGPRYPIYENGPSFSPERYNEKPRFSYEKPSHSDEKPHVNRYADDNGPSFSPERYEKPRFSYEKPSHSDEKPRYADENPVQPHRFSPQRPGFSLDRYFISGLKKLTFDLF